MRVLCWESRPELMEKYLHLMPDARRDGNPDFIFEMRGIPLQAVIQLPGRRWHRR
jgi:hypothetical protein